MLRVLLFTLIVGAFSVDPVMGNVPVTHQQEDVPSGKLDQSCGDPNECYASASMATCYGPSVTGIPSDCPSTISHITFMSTNVRTIPDGAFMNYRNLREIIFQHNTLRSIKRGAFLGLPYLEKLVLSFNKLSDTSFKDGPFDGLSSLKDVDLHANTLTRFPLHLFEGAKGLEGVHLLKNQISDMGPELHFSLNNLKEIDLIMNRLTHLNASMFHQMPNIERLALLLNPISVINDGHVFIGLTSLQKLEIDAANPFHCDCQASWMVEARAAGKIWAMEWDKGISPWCGSPKWMANKVISKLYPQDLTCEPPVIAPITSTNISHTRNTPFTLKATMELGSPYSTWVAPDGKTENDYRAPDRKLDIENGQVNDELEETNHSVVTTLKMDKYFDMTGLVNFTLIATNAGGDSNHIFWVYTDPASGVFSGGPPVYTSTLPLMLMCTVLCFL